MAGVGADHREAAQQSRRAARAETEGGNHMAVEAAAALEQETPVPGRRQADFEADRVILAAHTLAGFQPAAHQAMVGRRQVGVIHRHLDRTGRHRFGLVDQEVGSRQILQRRAGLGLVGGKVREGGGWGDDGPGRQNQRQLSHAQNSARSRTPYSLGAP